MSRPGLGGSVDWSVVRAPKGGGSDHRSLLSLPL